MPVVSVLMPAYNVEPYLAESIESVLAQTFGDWELLIVDDGSTDGSGALADAHASRDRRIRVVHQANAGLSAARNTGIRHARGTYLALLDSDDVWAPEFLAAQLDVFRARPVAIVTGNAYERGGLRDGQPSRPHPDTRPDPSLATILADTEAVFIFSVFHRDVVEAVGSFDERMRSNEDYDYWLRAAVAGFTFARNDRPLGYYRRRTDSLSASDVRMLRGILQVYRKLRPAVAGRAAELAILDRQVDRFETELIAAEARAAIESGDHATAAARLAALQSRRPAMAVACAALLARWAPGLLSSVYRARRSRLHARSGAAV